MPNRCAGSLCAFSFMAKGAIAFSQRLAGDIRAMLVNGEVGLVWHRVDTYSGCFASRLRMGNYATVDVIAVQTRLNELEFAVLGE